MNESDLKQELREARTIIDFLQDKNEDLEQANTSLRYMLNKSINQSNMRDIEDSAINGYKLK